MRMMKFLKATPEVVLRIEPHSMTLNWHWDAGFAVHKDFKGHTGGVLTMGAGAVAYWTILIQSPVRGSPRG